MASSDVRDVLNLPDGSAGPRPNKKARLSAPRPNLKGLAREVYSLGGDNPIAIVPEVTQFKKRRLASRKPAARWERKSFRNSGRDDTGLLLRHWRRVEESKTNDAPPGANPEGEAEQSRETKPQDKPEDIEDSTFAKFNVQVPVPAYTSDQYSQSLQSNDWSKDETDYLMALARDFDLRWPLIWDRYEYSPTATNGAADADGDESKAVVPATRSRSMEELKARYYEIAAKMMAILKPVQYMSQSEFAIHEVMAHFNPQQEKSRKEYALNTLSRPSEDAREEESLLLEIKRILARSERFNEDRRELYHRLDYPHAELTDISAFKSSSGLQTLIQTLMTVDKTKRKRSLMGGPDGQSPGAAAQQPGSGTAQEAAANATAAARRDSGAMANSNREGTAGSTGATPTATGGSKKGGGHQSAAQSTPSQANTTAAQTPQERRKLTPAEEAIYGVTHLERSASGPSFRSEKITKLFTTKSQTLQAKITNVLTELDVPPRLVMPCASTLSAYEGLLQAVNTLLDARKVLDKLDAEIKLEEAKRRERLGITEEEEAAQKEAAAKAAAKAAEEDEAGEGGVKNESGEKKKDEGAAEGDEAGADADGDVALPSADAVNGDAEDGKKDEEKASDEKKSDEKAVEDEEKAEATTGADTEDAKEADGSEDAAATADEAKDASTTAAANSHKRSASELSDDKSAKRQKK